MLIKNLPSLKEGGFRKMKRKIFRTLFALVLALSLSLVMAVPVAADPGTLNVRPFVVQATGGGTAAWSTSANRTGSWGVNIGTDTDGTDVGRVILAWNQNLSTITNMAYWYKLQAGNGAANWDSAPYVVLALDTTNDTSADTWVVHHMFAMSPGLDMTWLKWELSDGLIASQYMVTGNGTSMWHVAGATTIANINWSGIVTQFGSDTVLEIKIAVGDWASDIETRHYVDDIAINGVTYYGKIQDAIDTATALDTISVAAGTYTEDLTIPATKSNLELTPTTGAAVTIKGVATEPDASFPLAVPNIDILSSGVKIHGFTIEGPTAVASEYASGMLIGASNVEIYDNDFKVTAGRTTWTGAVSTGIVTYRRTATGMETVDISGLNIHDNTFTNLGTGAAGFDAIFVNLDAGTGTITIADNQFTGNVARAISVERSNVIISGNSIVTDLAPYAASAGGYQGMYIGCFPVGTDPGPVSANISITGNTVKGATTSEGFGQGIRVGHTTQVGLTNITVSRNIVQDSDEGITVRADATGVMVNYNEITGNTVGVQNDDTGVELDAEYNWYGGVAGPQHSKNPYDTEATSQSNDSVSDDVDFTPWMIHDTLVTGWNIWSTPVAAATGASGEPDTNTITEALDFWTSDSSKVTLAYYFNASSQAWAVATSLTPMQAVYLKLSSAATIDVCVSDSNSTPASRTMYAGWNLVGPAAFGSMQVDTALVAAYSGSGQTSLIGYQYAISPSVNQASWSYARDASGSGKNLLPTDGYWVYMVNQGLLNGFTYTPFTRLP